MSAANLLDKYQHHPVPQSYNAGFVALSCVVSLIGAASTLELISRRTGSKGLFNQYAHRPTWPRSLREYAADENRGLLVSSAVTMGGISIWCMVRGQDTSEALLDICLHLLALHRQHGYHHGQRRDRVANTVLERLYCSLLLRSHCCAPCCLCRRWYE